MDKRVNWQRACELLNCSKSQFYNLCSTGRLRYYATGARGRFVYEDDCRRILTEQQENMMQLDKYK